MSQQQAGTGTKAGAHNTTPLDDSPLEAAIESPPLLMFLMGIVEIIWGLICNGIQITTSTQAYMAATQEQAVRVKTLADLAAIQPKLFIIAAVIATAVQLIVLMNAMPISSVWRRMRQIQLSHVNATHAAQEVARHMSFRSYLFIVAFVGDVIGDARFVTMFTTDWVAVGLWIIMLTASSTIVFFDGWQRVWGALQSWRDYKLFHQQHYT